jgi:hypothetical protein
VDGAAVELAADARDAWINLQLALQSAFRVQLAA